MKVHNDLKEMLLEFYDWIVTNELYHNIPQRQEQRVDIFLERNSILALGKPEPLAKNKQQVEFCDCGGYMTIDCGNTCIDCKKPKYRD